MESDPNSLDPELRNARFFAIASPALGLFSLCTAIIPACGGIMSVLGIILGYVSLRTEHSRSAVAGVSISILGLLITITYAIFLLFFKN
jgi:hypothetical protein